MEDPRLVAVFLSVDEIINANRRLVIESGGPRRAAGSVNNPSSLYYVVEAGGASFQGQPLYPTIFHKAALYAFHISKDHVFEDGNKRTAMVCAFWFLRRNGYRLSPTLDNDEIVRVALGIADGSIPFEDVVRWLAGVAVQVPGPI